MDTVKRTVLAVDDNAADIEILRRYLGAIPGWQVKLVACASPIEAIAELERRSVDVVLVDYLLGEKTGIEVIQHIRASNDLRPVVVLTGQGDANVATAVMRSGANDYLSKEDLTPETLRRVIDGSIREYELRKEKLLLEEELRSAQKLEAIGTLAGGIAHDFNNILCGILGEAQLALIDCRQPEVTEHLVHIEDACRRMGDLIRRLLTFSRNDRVSRGPIGLNRIIDDLVVLLKHTIPKQIEIALRIPAEEFVVNATETGLQQILLNLCINAAEAMPDGGNLTLSVRAVEPSDGIRLALASLTEPAYAVIEVQDSGIGIAPEIRERIFEPFFTTKLLSAQKGTGLGLALVWELTREFDGLVKVYSELGRGSTFRVYLPRIYAPAAVAARGLRTPPVPHGQESVLVVDDEPAVLDITSRMLQRLGYTVYVARDGQAALVTFAELHDAIDAVILDLSMPDMTGQECSQRLREIEPDICLIFASGHNLEDLEKDLRQLGARAVIQKPFQLSDLAVRLRAALDTNTG